MTDFIAYTQTHISVISHTPRRKTCASDWINDTGMHHEGEHLSIYLSIVLTMLCSCRVEKEKILISGSVRSSRSTWSLNAAVTHPGVHIVCCVSE